MIKKYWIVVLVLILVLLAVVMAAARFGFKKQPVSHAPISQNPVPQVDVKTVAPAEIPKELPVNLPWEQGVQVLQNFEAKYPATGKTQSTRAYVSAKTLDDSFAIYQKYLRDNGWTIVSSINQTGIKNLSAAKDGARLDITFAKDAGGKNTINVSYVN